MYKGIFLSVLSSILFGVIYYYPILLQPLSVVDIFCWRLLMSFPAIVILIILERQWAEITNLFKRIYKNPSFIFTLLLSAALLSIQMFIFVWAPIAGRALSASLGYFMLPLVMVVCGRIFYKERFRFLQKIAVSMAAFGVALQAYITQAFSWDTIVISVGYPIYFMFRKKMQIDGISGTFSDFFFLAISCFVYFMIKSDMHKMFNELTQFVFLIPSLGIITAVAFAAYFTASRLLPLGLFGLFGYAEPVLLTIVSIFFMNESISTEHIMPYFLIWGAVVFLMLDGIYICIRHQRKTEIQ